jgi:SAM-dependent methyltransferase
VSERPSCPACGRPLDPSRGWHALPRGAFVECVCGAAVLSPLPLQVLAEHYGQDYWGGAHGYVDYEADRQAHRRNFRDVLAWIAAHRAGAAPGACLEIGCGPGHFLDLLREEGWEIRGVEYSPAAAARAAGRLGEGVVQAGDAALACLPAGRFDLVLLHDVLEHLPRPVAVLSGAAAALAPHGLVFLDFWDRGSRAARLLGSRWHALDPPDHLLHYDRCGVAALVERAGLRRLDERVSGRHLTLRAAAGKLLPARWLRGLPPALGNVSFPVNLRDRREWLLARGAPAAETSPAVPSADSGPASAAGSGPSR